MKTKIHALLIPILFISLLSGCATTKLTQEQIDNGDYGPPPPSNYQEVSVFRLIGGKIAEINGGGFEVIFTIIYGSAKKRERAEGFASARFVLFCL